MPTFLKTEAIEAEQWFPGKKVKGVYGDDPDSILICGCATGAKLMKPHVHTMHGGQVTILAPGDWIVPEGDGEHYYPIDARKMSNSYEPEDGHWVTEIGTRIRVELKGTDGLEYLYDNDPDVPRLSTDFEEGVEREWVEYGTTHAMKAPEGAGQADWWVDVRTLPTAEGDPVKYAKILAEQEKEKE